MVLLANYSEFRHTRTKCRREDVVSEACSKWLIMYLIFFGLGHKSKSGTKRISKHARWQCSGRVEQNGAPPHTALTRSYPCHTPPFLPYRYDPGINFFLAGPLYMPKSTFNLGHPFLAVIFACSCFCPS